MSVLIKGAKMPKDCPMCPLSHWNKLDEFTGCEVVNGKRFAVTNDKGYAQSNTRPSWCPLVEIPPHGRLIDADNLDVEPVRHGHWEKKDDPYGYFDKIPVCSECGRTTELRKLYAYCPNCGAKMDGKE